jgi:hypothetical protein
MVLLIVILWITRRQRRSAPLCGGAEPFNEESPELCASGLSEGEHRARRNRVGW